MTVQQPSRKPLKLFSDWFLDTVDNSQLGQLDAIMLALFVFAAGCGLILMIYVLAAFQNTLHHQARVHYQTPLPDQAPYSVRAHSYTVPNGYVVQQIPASRFGRPRQADLWQTDGLPGGRAEASNYRPLY